MTNRDFIIKKCEKAALIMRQKALKMALMAGPNGAHIGPGLSIIEIMSTLYCGVMNYNKENLLCEKRDRFILSKGHGTLGYYTALNAAGILSDEQLFSFEKNGGLLPGQPSLNRELGIDFSSGSLGMGLSYAVGISLAGRLDKLDYRLYVLMGDGELNEGTVWEAAMSASHFGMSNVIAIIDANGLQSDGKTNEIMLTNINDMWEGFGWEVINVENGHNIGLLYDALTLSPKENKPRVIVAKTVKGKGISFMESNNEWHHNRLSQEQYEAALAKLEGGI